MSELPLVSCIVPTYNFAQYVARTLDSLLAQEYPQERLEIIVIDDGSTDDTPSVVEPYLDRITYIRKPNGGVRTTINRGLAEAHGDLITFLSGDDICLPGRFQAQVSEMQARPELGLLYGDMTMIDAEDRTIAQSFWATAKITPVRGRPLASLIRHNVVSGGTIMVRAALRERFDPLPEFAPWEDWWIALRVSQVADIDFLRTPLIGYRWHDTNMNLGAQGPRLTALVEAELPLRRWMLTDMESDLLSEQEWLVTYRDWRKALERVTAGGQATTASLIPVSEQGSARALVAARAALEHLAAGEQVLATRECVRALGLDPFAPAPQQALAVLTGGGEDLGLDDLDVRAFVTLADADELVSDPDLLAAYGRTFSGDDDASLVVIVAHERIAALSSLVEELGLDDERASHLVGVPFEGGGEPPLEKLAPHVHAVLSRREASGTLALYPRADDGDLDRLRSLAQRRWAS